MAVTCIKIDSPDQLLICNDRNETQTACDIHLIRRSIHPRGAFFALQKTKKEQERIVRKQSPPVLFYTFLYIMMTLGSKGILTPLIPDCSVLRTLTILKNIRNSLIFLRKMATYSCFWQVPRSEIFLQASLRQISDLLTLVSSYNSVIANQYNRIGYPLSIVS